MKRLAVILAGLLILGLGFFLGQRNTVKAQTSAPPWQVTVSGSHSLCTPVSGQTTFCFASDGLWQSLAGGAFTQLGGSQAAPTITINGKSGTTFTLTSAAPTITSTSSSTAPALSVTAQ